MERYELECVCGHPQNRHVNGMEGCSEKIALLGERIPHPEPKFPGEKTYSTSFDKAMSSPETNCKCEKFTPRPRKGDRFENGWIVDYVAEGVVWIVGKPNSPIPLENVAPTERPGFWRLVKLKSDVD